MSKKTIRIVYFILFVVIIKLGYDYFGTNNLIKNYKKDIYLGSLAKSIARVNIVERYVSRYNYGNILYQNEQYESAIHQYELALKEEVPKRKECKIRINYALAICKLVDVDESDDESVNKAIQLYELAIDVLTKHGCATKFGTGHDKDAQQLEEDIQREIDRLKSREKRSKPQKDEGGEGDDENSNPDENDDEVDELEAKMQEIKEDALSTQREYEQNVDRLYNLKDLFLNNSPSRKW